MGHSSALDLIAPTAGPLLTTLLPLLASTATGEGGGGFLNGNTITAPPLLDNEMNQINVNDADTTTLINNIQIRDINSISQGDTQYLVDSLNRLGNNAVEKEQAIAAFKARDPYRDGSLHSDGYRQQDQFQQEALKKMHGSDVPTKGLDDDAAKLVKKRTRRPTDKYYVSREPHEFDFCMKPLKHFGFPGTTIEHVAAAGDHTVNSNPGPDLGLFINAKEFRKGIELWRRLVNVVRGENVKRIAELTGTDQYTMLQSFIAEPGVKAELVAACTGVPFLLPD